MSVEPHAPKPRWRSAAPSQTPLISVIINNFNYGRFVGEAIESVLAQTYRHVECIVVDDGSTDNSLEVIRSYPDIRLIAKPNGGQVSAAIEGFQVAQGDVVMFLDSDDMLDPNACKVIAQRYSPGYAMYQFKLEMRGPDGRRVGEYPLEPFVRGDLIDHICRHGYIPASPTSGNAFSHTHVARMFCRIDDTPKLFIDGFLIYSAPFTGEVDIIDQPLGVYRVHGSNVSLSAGLDVASARNDILNAIWQRTAIVECLRDRGDAVQTPYRFLSPYHLRNALLLRAGYPDVDGMDFMSASAMAALCIRNFLKHPNLSVWQRIKNIVLVSIVPWSPPALARHVIPRDRKRRTRAPKIAPGPKKGWQRAKSLPAR